MTKEPGVRDARGDMRGKDSQVFRISYYIQV